jgi:glycolate oxidase iron-sulfur subunit
MQHNIPVDNKAPLINEIANAVEKCVHCGFCLPTCPTYRVLRNEMDSPRGRIILMKSVLEEKIDLEDALPYIDRCLGCLSCVTACPSGVPYNEMITPFKVYASKRRKRTFTDRTSRRLILETIPYPTRFRYAAGAGRLAKPFVGLLPESFRGMLGMIPESLPQSENLPEVFPAEGKMRARVAILSGCVQQVVAPEINWSTLRVLAKNGVEVLIPPQQGCCGAIAIHTGDIDLARTFAANNMHAFPMNVDAIITNAAGCGSGMKDYPLIFKGTDLENKARLFTEKVQDISVFLRDFGIIEPPSLKKPLRVAYHDACHLSHAQGITIEPRELLGQIQNLTLLNLSESELCCGSAGTYNLEQPETAHLLGERKVNHIIEVGAEAVVTGNIGCLVQLRSNLNAVGLNIPVWHTLELLDLAYREKL